MAIREYAYQCNDCDYKFTEFLDWNHVDTYKPRCPHCKKNGVYRDYGAERVSVDDGNPKTVGALADKHAKEMGIQINPKPRLEL